MTRGGWCGSGRWNASLKNWCEKNGESFEAWWQSDETERYHFIGKDIVRFHCLFWPAMLHAADFKLPTQVFVHGFLTVNGEKMSKSKGTFIKAETYLKFLKAQDLRFYYACKLNGTTDDLDLNLDDWSRGGFGCRSSTSAPRARRGW